MSFYAFLFRRYAALSNGVFMKNALRFFRASQYGDDRAVVNFVLFLFIAGMIIGAVVGSFGSVPEGSDITEYFSLFSGGDVPADFLGTYVLFSALPLLCGTSFLGTFIIPAVILVKAYSMSCTVAAVYAYLHLDGLVCAVFSIGVPTLLFLPCFFVCSCSGITSAQQLYALKLGVPWRGCTEARLAGCACGAVICLTIMALYAYFLMPLIFKFIF